MDKNQTSIQVSRIERVMKAAAAFDANNQQPVNHQKHQVPRIERVMQAAAAADANNQPPINQQTGEVPRIERVMRAAAGVEIPDAAVGAGGNDAAEILNAVGGNDEGSGITSSNGSLRVEANASYTSGEHSMMRFSISTHTGDSLLERRAHPPRVYLLNLTSSDSAFSGSMVADEEDVSLQFQIRRWRQHRPMYPPGHVPWRPGGGDDEQW